jgi:NADH-quinone oxidoreductase subunit M
MLWLVQRVFFGPLREPHHESGSVSDLRPREIVALAPIAVVCLWIGLYPNFFLSRMEPAVHAVAERISSARPPRTADIDKLTNGNIPAENELQSTTN